MATIYYGMVTKFTTATTDVLSVAMSIGNANIGYTLFRYGVAPYSGSIHTNTAGFGTTVLPAGAVDALVKVDMPIPGAVRIEQFQSSGGSNILSIAVPSEQKAFALDFEMARFTQQSDFLLIGNKWAFGFDVNVISLASGSTPVYIYPLTVSKVPLPTVGTYVRVSSPQLQVMVQMGVNSGFASSLVMPP